MDHDEFGILNRLILNVRIEPSPEGVMRILGMVHLYTASGLHLIALERFLHRIFVRNLSDQRKLSIIFWLFLILIWKLQGFRLGFARILILFFIRTWARQNGYRWRVFYPLLVAFCFDFALGIEAGWSHYYLALLGGMLGLEKARHESAFRQHLSLSVCSWLMTAPLDLWEHQTISWATPFWSLITIPLISLILYPVTLGSYLILDRVPEALIWIWNEWIRRLWEIVDAGITFSVADPSQFRVTLVFSVLLGFAFQRFNRSRERVILLLSAFILLVLLRHPFQTRLVQLDVGQGDSLLIQNRSKSEMIDVGGSHPLRPEAMIQRLAQQGITRIDTLLLTHLDEDHVGGIRQVLPWVGLGEVEFDQRFTRAPRVWSWLELQPNVRYCGSGCFQSGWVDWISDRKKRFDGNSLMGTVGIPVDHQTLYLNPGDADHEQEQRFWNRNRIRILAYSSRILKVSHHGSNHSTSSEWIRNIKPSLAVISVGRKNRYHHPHQDVLNRLSTENIRIHRTDRDGAFELIR